MGWAFTLTAGSSLSHGVRTPPRVIGTSPRVSPRPSTGSRTGRSSPWQVRTRSSLRSSLPSTGRGRNAAGNSPPEAPGWVSKKSGPPGRSRSRTGGPAAFPGANRPVTPALLTSRLSAARLLPGLHEQARRPTSASRAQVPGRGLPAHPGPGDRRRLVSARCGVSPVRGHPCLPGLPRGGGPPLRHLQNLVSARPSSSAASPQASSALRMQRRRTKPLRGGPTAGSPMRIEWSDPMPPGPPGGAFGVRKRSSSRLGVVAMKSAGVVIQGVPTPPVEGGRSRTRV